LKTWKLSFEDHFADDKLDSKKWMTRHYWGDQLLDSNYSLPGDQHCSTDGKNISLSDSKLSIVTKNQNASGFSWNSASGFIYRDFSYTSGVINTGKSFRHAYGKIEDKIRIPKGNAYHAFWLAGERMLPQINIFKYSKKKFHLGNFWGNMFVPNGLNKDITTVTGAFAGKFYIFSLEWTPKQLEWKINGRVFKTMYRGIPSEPMYIAFASGVEEDMQLSNPVNLEIDWIRFYTKA
jgi:beta-glucanase (GH16 family)